jgi:hypothetical protein
VAGDGGDDDDDERDELELDLETGMGWDAYMIMTFAQGTRVFGKGT